jgi:hypothetical protein
MLEKRQLGRTRAGEQAGVLLGGQRELDEQRFARAVQAE